MPGTTRTDLVRSCFAAFAADRPEVVEAAITGGFTFSSPADPLLDREGFFARCWPNAGRVTAFSVLRRSRTATRSS